VQIWKNKNQESNCSSQLKKRIGVKRDGYHQSSSGKKKKEEEDPNESKRECMVGSVSWLEQSGQQHSTAQHMMNWQPTHMAAINQRS
jgi:hypothetical protein